MLVNRTSLNVILATMTLTTFTPTASATLHPGLGRFMQRDPLEYLDGMNMFAYVHNAPLSERDPSGTYAGFPGHGNPKDPLAAAITVTAVQNGADHAVNQLIAKYPSLEPLLTKYRNLIRYYAFADKIGTSEQNMFIYTCGCGVIDTGHLLNNAMIATGAGRFSAWLASLINETGQLIGPSDSAFTPEDLPSNKLGRDLASGVGLGSDIAAAFDQMLVDCGALRWVPPDVLGKSVEQWIQADIAGAQAAYKKDPRAFRAYTARQGRAYMRQSEWHRCLCDGDTPKHAGHQYRGLKAEGRRGQNAAEVHSKLDEAAAKHPTKLAEGGSMAKATTRHSLGCCTILGLVTALCSACQPQPSVGLRTAATLEDTTRPNSQMSAHGSVSLLESQIAAPVIAATTGEHATTKPTATTRPIVEVAGRGIAGVVIRPQKDADGRLPHDVVEQFFVAVARGDIVGAQQWWFDDPNVYPLPKQSASFDEYFSQLRSMDKLVVGHTGKGKGAYMIVAIEAHGGEAQSNGHGAYWLRMHNGRWRIVRWNFW